VKYETYAISPSNPPADSPFDAMGAGAASPPHAANENTKTNANKIVNPFFINITSS
jgi:hypothetical protein